MRFDRRNDIINRIYSETAAQPNLIQFYCSILVERLDRDGSRSISPESLFDVYGNDDFRAFVLSTFMDNTTHLEKAIVFAVMVLVLKRLLLSDTMKAVNKLRQVEVEVGKKEEAIRRRLEARIAEVRRD